MRAFVNGFAGGGVIAWWMGIRKKAKSVDFDRLICIILAKLPRKSFLSTFDVAAARPIGTTSGKAFGARILRRRRHGFLK